MYVQDVYVREKLKELYKSQNKVYINLCRLLVFFEPTNQKWQNKKEGIKKCSYAFFISSFFVDKIHLIHYTCFRLVSWVTNHLSKGGDIIILNPNSSEPIFNQIAQLIKDEILEGNYQVGEQVPSSNELSKLLQINPATARKGLTLLVDAGILYKKRGIGMFVCKNAPQLIRNEKSAHFKSDYLKNMLREAKKIGLSKIDLIELIKSTELED